MCESLLRFFRVFPKSFFPLTVHFSFLSEKKMQMIIALFLQNCNYSRVNTSKKPVII